ncbi:MAG: LysM domain-containing protein [Deltaproteobacteria bacterium]|nr:LysM domain-containing protein [Deltaproteobacteria bacterium]
MESEIKLIPSTELLVLLLILLLGISFPALSTAQEQRTGVRQEEPAQLRLRKTLRTRKYQGKLVEGEERIINPGDSLWRILIQEKGLSEKRFHRYLFVIGSLNPHLKVPDILRVGEIIFIPIRPDEILGIEISSGKAKPRVYRVRRGDNLYKILWKRFGIRGKEKTQSTFSQVKKLNPNKTNWNILFIGEALLFPGQGWTPRVAAGKLKKPKPKEFTSEIIGLDYGEKLLVRENLYLLERVMGALGNETLHGGEELVALQEGTIRIDRGSYPIIYNPKMAQRVMLDVEGQIPSSLRTQMEAESSAIPVVSLKKGVSLHEAVTSLLSRLGFQSLPAERPVVIQDRGVRLQVKGEWMVTTPEEMSGRQEIFIISLTDVAGKTPDYLRDYFSFKGMNLKDILLSPSSPSPISISLRSGGQREESRIERWPADKSALVDAFLKSYQIPFSADHQLLVSLREGIRLETKVDRFFEFGGKKVALLFHPVGKELKRALQEREGVRAIELDPQSLSSRELISSLLEAIGEGTAYREHRFSAIEGGAKNKVVLTVSGFVLPNRKLFLTDREIPNDLEQFFSEKGLRIVYFR